MYNSRNNKCFLYFLPNLIFRQISLVFVSSYNIIFNILNIPKIDSKTDLIQKSKREIYLNDSLNGYCRFGCSQSFFSGFSNHCLWS